MEVRRVDLANWDLRTSPKFTTGVQINASSIRLFDQIRDPEILIIFHLYIIIHHHLNVLPKGRFFTANSGTEVAVLSKGRASIANSETKVAFLLGMSKCGSFLLLPAPHSLFSI